MNDRETSADAIVEPTDASTRLEHWIGLVRAHPWPVAIAVLSVLWLLVLIPWPTTPDAEIDLLEGVDAPIAELTLDARSAADTPSGAITAKRIRVAGHVLLASPAALIANEIEFAPDARILSPGGDLTVLASRIVHGAFDVSGVDGRDGHAAGESGQAGGNAGSIYIASADAADTVVDAHGGRGGAGQRGYAGAPGRNGFCGPRGFGLAERGAAGGAGGDAGSGGNGGVVTAWYSTAAPKLSAPEGMPGAAARGGPGGRGGAGCKGVRGHQPAQSSGNEGPTGRPGSRGQAGVVATRHVDFDAVVDAYERWLGEHASVEVLRDRLRALPTRDLDAG